MTEKTKTGIMIWTVIAVLCALIFVSASKASSLRASDEEPKGNVPKLTRDMKLVTPVVVVFTLRPDDGSTPTTVVVVRGKLAQRLSEQCNCTSQVYREDHLVILLDPSVEV